MRIYKYGGPEVFEWDEIPLPNIKDNELLVKVYGSSVNPVDCAIRQGNLKGVIRLELPTVLGVDVSGLVEKVGKHVTRFMVGDRVYAFQGLDRNGGYAEYAAVPESYAATIPVNLNISQAGVVPVAGLTAYQSFTQTAPLNKGMQVLINGAGGGVGTFAIQIAKALGAQVTAVCSESKAELVKRLGADLVVNYHRENILDSGKKFDVILNCVRGSKINKWKKLLKKNGQQIVIAANPLQMPFVLLSNLFSSQKSLLFKVKADGKSLRGLSELITQRKVKPIISKTFALQALTRAHSLFESESVEGKMSISMEENHSILKIVN